MEKSIDQPDEDINIIMQNYKDYKKNYKTTPILTKYERTRVLSERASQINDGSQTLLKIDKYDNAYDIALAEFNAKKIPFIIKRPYGNTFEYWKITDLY
jgi:DNA-directed RNA polymerase subunit K/omega